MNIWWPLNSLGQRILFHHAVGNDRPGSFGLEWLSNSRQKTVWSNGPKKTKGHTDQRKPGGKTRVGNWFPHKNLRSHPPTPWKSMLRTQHKWCGFSIKNLRYQTDTKHAPQFVSKQKQTQQLKDIHCKCVCFKEGCLRFVEKTSNNNLVFWRQRRKGNKRGECDYITETRRSLVQKSLHS